MVGVQTGAFLCGSSTSHRYGTVGTIGAVVFDPRTPTQRFVLSNHHVLVNRGHLRRHTEVLIPGTDDGGWLPDDHLASLHAWAPLRFDADNRMDAALARLHDPASVLPQQRLLGAHPTTLRAPELGMRVCKVGRTSDLTFGVITEIGAWVEVRFGHHTARFTGQLLIRGDDGQPFSRGGDSGALVLSADTLHPVALLFAANPLGSFATPLARVLDAFGVRLASLYLSGTS